MKKLLALALALLMAMSCVIASAETYGIHLNIDRDQATALIAPDGSDDQKTLVDTVVALLNALGVNVSTDDEGAQIDLDLKDQPVLSLAFATDDQGISVVSNLFPNYMVTISQDTITEYMKNVPGVSAATGASNGQDMTAVTEAVSGYVSKFSESITASATLGDPETGSYAYEGYTFDTMIPVTVDVPAAAEAFKTFITDLANDPTVRPVIEASLKSSNSDTDLDSLVSELDDLMTHCPESVTSEFYCFGDGSSSAFYLVGEGTYADKDNPSFAYSLLHKEDDSLAFTLSIDESNITIGFQYTEGAIRVDYYQGETYCGFDMTFSAGDPSQANINLYYMNANDPLISLAFTAAEGNNRTLSTTQDGRTVVALEDIIANSDNAEGLVNDIMNNGLGSLMTVISAVPEASNLMNLFN